MKFDTCRPSGATKMMRELTICFLDFFAIADVDSPRFARYLRHLEKKRETTLPASMFCFGRPLSAK